MRAVHEVHRAFPHVPIIGQGGVAGAEDALELILAGASYMSTSMGYTGIPSALAAWVGSLNLSSYALIADYFPPQRRARALRRSGCARRR